LRYDGKGATRASDYIGEMLMARGWYHNRQHEQRLLSIEEIAGACCINNSKVKEWVTDHHLKRARAGEDLLDAAEVVSFLVRHNMPVSPWLLPPKTKKILLIANTEVEFQELADKFDHICKFFAENCNILVETAIAGRYADLSIFTFAPNVVVIFIQEYDEHTANTLNFLSSIPERKTILLVDDLIEKAVDDGLLTLSAHLIVGKMLPAGQLRSRLQSVFANRA
jgi:hypothetical protein